MSTRSSKWSMDDIKKLPVHMVKDYTNQPNNRSIVIDNQEVFKKVKKEMKHTESDMQINCFETFRMIYPKYRYKYFAIPNGGYRNAMEAGRMKQEGLLHGCLDSFLAVPKGKWGGMFIEFKSSTGRLSEYQVQFIKEVQDDYYCCVCRSVEQFLKEIKEYLSDDNK